MHPGGYLPVRSTRKREDAGEVFFLEKIMGRFIDLTGQRFGRLVVRELKERKLPFYWVCDCDCGGINIVQGGHLKNGNVKSCGCIAKEATAKRSIKHGMHSTAEYKTWQQMKERCLNQKGKDFHKYGGRGISICDAWVHSFESFLAHVGKRPAGCKSLDRINNNGDYSPGNVRWATPAQQSRNTRSTKLTAEKVSNIKARLCLGEPQHSVAASYGVTQQYVSKIANGKAWKDVGPTP